MLGYLWNTCLGLGNAQVPAEVLLKRKMQLPCHLSCQDWTMLQQSIVGHAVEPVLRLQRVIFFFFFFLNYQENCHVNKEVRSHPFSVSCTGCLLKAHRLQNKIVQLYHEWHNTSVPVPLGTGTSISFLHVIVCPSPSLLFAYPVLTKDTRNVTLGSKLFSDAAPRL